LKAEGQGRAAAAGWVEAADAACSWSRAAGASRRHTRCARFRISGFVQDYLLVFTSFIQLVIFYSGIDSHHD